MTSLERSEMKRADKSAAADFDRPLLLTPGADMTGYALGKAGHGLLFTIAAVSVLAVLGIFGFIIYEGGTFLQTRGGDEFVSQQGQAVRQAINAYEEVLIETGDETAAAAAAATFRGQVTDAPTPTAQAELARQAYLNQVARAEYAIALKAIGNEDRAEERAEYYRGQANELFAAFHEAPEGAVRRGALQELVDRTAAGVRRTAMYDTGNHTQAKQASEATLTNWADRIYQEALANTEISDEQARQRRENFIKAIDPSFAFQVETTAARFEEAFTGSGWYPQGSPSEYGMLALMYGSLSVTVGALLIAVPFGLIVAVVLSDIIPFGVRQVVKPIIELLAAIPSVAWGFFAIMVVAPWLQNEFHLSTGANALNASLILAIMAIPTIVSVAEDALTALGRDLREASYAMGATRFETIFKVVIPAAHNGILAAIILGMMRAIGETMVVWMAAGNAAQIPGGATPWYDLAAIFQNLTQSVRTMTATIAGEMGETSEGSVHRSGLYVVGMILLVFTFILNLIMEYLVSRFHKGMGGGTKAEKPRTAWYWQGLDLIKRSAVLILLAGAWGLGFAVIGVVLVKLAGWLGLGSGMLPLHVQGYLWMAGFLVRMFLALGHLLADDALQHLRTKVAQGFARILDPIRIKARMFTDKGFTCIAFVSVILLVGALLLVLVPIFSRGSGAVVFKETIEHRQFLMDAFDRGSKDELAGEWEKAMAARMPVYDLLDTYAWLSPDLKIDDVEGRYRDTGKMLEDKQAKISARVTQLSARIGSQRRDGDEVMVAKLIAERDELSKQLEAMEERVKQAKRQGRRLRRHMVEAYESEDKDEAIEALDYVLNFEDRALFAGTPMEAYWPMAQRYKASLATADLSLRRAYTKQAPTLTYSDAYQDVRNIITGRDGTGCILGRRVRGEEVALLPPEVKYGATRWAMVERYHQKLNTATVWVAQTDAQGNILTSEETEVPRASLFEGTAASGFTELFNYVDTHLEDMLRPEWKFYWRYFTDKSTAGHFLGGIGREVLGTLLVTVVTIAIALPLGLIAAAYLIEVAGDNIVVRMIRLCINTLAGVPSIVFGLFGMTFFVIWFLPKFGLAKDISMLAGGLTLMVLVLPIIIRASEEAIRSVPGTYKEASLGLGAGRLRCFLTVQLPAALPGVLTGTILAMGRAAGETAPIMFTAAAATATGPIIWDLTKASPMLSYTALDMAVGDRTATMVPWNQYGVVATLITLVLLLNLAAILIRIRISKRLRGG